MKYLPIMNLILTLVMATIFILTINKKNDKIKELEQSLFKKECEMSRINTKLDFCKGIKNSYGTPRNN